MRIPTQLDQNFFRIVIYRTTLTELLLETRPDGLRIPVLSVASHTRFAEEITAAIRSQWNLETFCLFVLPSEASSSASLRCQVMEVCRPRASAPAGMQWFPVRSLSADLFEDPTDIREILSSLVALDQYRRGEIPGAFGKPGACDRVTQWVESEAARVGFRLTGEFRQFNAGPAFSLIRFATDGPALWFKAVGEPNAHEPRVSLKLASLFPGFLPRIIGARPEWNAWLSVEAAGVHLSSSSAIHEWEQAANALANLQFASIGKEFQFIETGCKDVRASSLLALVDPFFERMVPVMEQQTKTTPRPLLRREISSLANEIKSALFELGASDLPNVLGHLDFNPGNILISKEACVFIDWAEAAVGHPFLTFQYLLEHWRRFDSSNPASEGQLVSSYTKRWQRLVSPETIASGLLSVPLLALVAYSLVALTWQESDLAACPERTGYLRSLVRRMNREAETLRQRRLICVR
jgi:Phosphotransferase enzyme family